MMTTIDMSEGRMQSTEQICHFTHTDKRSFVPFTHSGNIAILDMNFSVTLLRIASIWRSNRLYHRNHNLNRNVMDEHSRMSLAAAFYFLLLNPMNDAIFIRTGRTLLHIPIWYLPSYHIQSARTEGPSVPRWHC